MPRILIVDDDPHIRQALGERFAARKFDVSHAGSGRDAFAKIVREQPDVVLLGLQPPEGDGLSVLRRSREEEDEPTVVVNTAFGSIDKAVQGMTSRRPSSSSPRS